MDDRVAKAAERYRSEITAILDAVGGDGKSGSGFRIAMSRCDSPIEQAFCLELFQVPGVCAIEGDFDARLLALAPPDPVIVVFAQQPILQYRADFLLVGISPLSAEPIFLIVECDSVDYHSTREQLRRDEYRQRALQNTGFRVIRFRGSDIYHIPLAVITRTISQFIRHGWNPALCPNWVNGGELYRALAQLREIDSSFREEDERERRGQAYWNAYIDDINAAIREMGKGKPRRRTQ